MKKFFKSLDWWKFIKYELSCLAIVGGLYMLSPNRFPENFYVIPLIMFLWGIMLIVKSHSMYIITNHGKNNR